ncbi:hypothetical protein EIP86_008770 [Pleurotus ostreatoroseus]|nr:hypothetical protein EIP86_008770 [Pleurotus ostreatoroseus]
MAASPITVSHLDFSSASAYATLQVTTRLRALLMPIDGHPTYQAMLVQHTNAGPTIPSIASSHSQYTITIPAIAAEGLYDHSKDANSDDQQTGALTFSIFYSQLPAERVNANRAVRAFLGGRVFYGELVIFRVGSRGMRFVNLRSGDRAMAFEAAAR